MCRTLRLARARKRLDRVVEDVSEALGESCHGVGRSVHLDGDVTLVRQRANVVDAVHVVGVIVGEKNRVDLTDAGVDQLKSQLRRRVDEYSHASVRLDQRADSGPLVTRISGSANLAGTADLGDAKAGPSPQKGEFQTVSTFRRLVVPGMSNGTPAVTMMRSPLLASSRSATTSFVRSIISS